MCGREIDASLRSLAMVLLMYYSYLNVDTC
jgi:hypothetical protein